MRRRRNPSLHRSKLIRKSFFTDSMRSLSSIKNAAFEQMTRDVVMLEMTPVQNGSCCLSNQDGLLRAAFSVSIQKQFYVLFIEDVSVSKTSCVSVSGSEWRGSKVCRAWWGRRWTTSCRPSSGSLSTWTSWSRPCCSTCRTAKTWTGTDHTEFWTRLFSVFTDILLHEFRAAGERSERFPEVRTVLLYEATLLKGQIPTHNNSKPINYTCSAGGNQWSKPLHLQHRTFLHLRK